MSLGTALASAGEPGRGPLGLRGGAADPASSRQAVPPPVRRAAGPGRAKDRATAGDGVLRGSPWGSSTPAGSASTGGCANASLSVSMERRLVPGLLCNAVSPPGAGVFCRRFSSGGELRSLSLVAFDILVACDQGRALWLDDGGGGPGRVSGAQGSPEGRAAGWGAWSTRCRGRRQRGGTARRRRDGSPCAAARREGSRTAAGTMRGRLPFTGRSVG